MNSFRPFETKIEKDHFDLAQAYLVASTPRHFGGEIYKWGFDSPIEVIFHIWWLAFIALSNPRLESRPQDILTIAGRTYRLDFHIRTNDHWLVRAAEAARIPVPSIAVELDGHEFHERTREDVIARNERDRDLQQAGLRVLHFSYDEITGAPQRCISEAIAAGQDQIVALEHAVLAARGPA